MKFIPNAVIKDEMLKEIGITSIDELFSDIPKPIRIENISLENFQLNIIISHFLLCLTSPSLSEILSEICPKFRPKSLRNQVISAENANSPERDCKNSSGLI